MVANVSNVSVTCSDVTHTVSGSVSGLGTGKQVTLQNNAGNSTTVSANGSFTFSTPVAYNGSYAVTVGTQPTGQTCTVSNGSGSGVVANVSNVSVTCLNDPVVEWTVTGLVSSVDTALASNFTAGDTFTMKFTYNPSQSPVFIIGRRVDRSLNTISIKVGNVEFTGGNERLNWSIFNDAPYDEFIVGYTPLNGLRISGLNIPKFYMGLVDFTATRFDTSFSPPTSLGNLTTQSLSTFISYEDPIANASRRVYINVVNISVIAIGN